MPIRKYFTGPFSSAALLPFVVLGLSPVPALANNGGPNAAAASEDTPVLNGDVAGAAAPAADSPSQPPQTPEGQLSQEEFAQLAAFANSVFARDNITIGAGLGLIPSYEGSDNYTLFPAPQIRGSVSGYQFSSPGGGPGLAVDLAKDAPLSKTEIIAGPLVRVNLNRAIASQINDPVVEALGDLDTAIELGGQFGVRLNGITGRFDNITLQTNISYDVAGAHSGLIVSPSVTYSKPIKNFVLLSLTASLDWVDGNYADFYYGIDAAGALASGLDEFDASSGVKSVSLTSFAAFDLNGNALDGGFALFVLGGYSRLRESAAATPITSVRGDPNQFIAALGVGYTF